MTALDKEILAERVAAVNRIVHAYEDLDMQKVYKIAQNGPKDLVAFLASANKWIQTR